MKNIYSFIKVNKINSTVKAIFLVKLLVISLEEASDFFLNSDSNCQKGVFNCQ